MNKFIKYHGPDVNQDWERVNFFYRLSRNQRSYLFPRPLKISKQKIIYEKLENLLPVADCLNLNNYNKIISKTGAALADIHKHSKTSNLTHLHCDFGLINLAWQPKEELPVIFDPIPSGFYRYKNYFGSKYYDVGQLISSIFTLNYYLNFFKISYKMPLLITRTFVDSYERNSMEKLDRKTLARYSGQIHRDYYKFMQKKTNDFRYFIGKPVILLLRFLMLWVIKCR